MTSKSAVILCGGLGTRLRSVLADKPKCMAPVGEHPFLYFLLVQLEQGNFTEVILSTGYLSEIVEAYIKQVKASFTFKIKIAKEEEPLGTGGAILYAANFATSEDCLVMNGDTFYQIDLDSLYTQHLQSKAAISIALKPMKNADRYGLVHTDERENIIAFEEKKLGASGNINGGIYIIKNSVWQKWMGGPRFSFEKEFLEPNLKQYPIKGFIHDAYFIDIGIPEDYERGQNELPKLIGTPQ